MSVLNRFFSNFKCLNNSVIYLIITLRSKGELSPIYTKQTMYCLGNDKQNITNVNIKSKDF